MKSRIISGAIDGEYKENFSKFLLNCQYDMIPKSQQTVELKGDNIKFSFGVGTDKAEDNEE